MDVQMIHLIGNSHVSTFSNQTVPPARYFFDSEYFKANCLNAITAYNFYDNHKEFINDYIRDKTEEGDKISFIAGEVDCRIHIPKQADEQNITDEESVLICLNKFLKVILMPNWFKNREPIAFGVHPSTNEPHSMDNKSRPIYGSMERRNNISVLWNKHLKAMCENIGIKFVSIYDYLVNDNNETKMEYFGDYCHLNSVKVYQFIIKEFKAQGLI